MATATDSKLTPATDRDFGPNRLGGTDDFRMNLGSYLFDGVRVDDRLSPLQEEREERGSSPEEEAFETALNMLGQLAERAYEQYMEDVDGINACTVLLPAHTTLGAVTFSETFRRTNERTTTKPLRARVIGFSYDAEDTATLRVRMMDGPNAFGTMCATVPASWLIGQIDGQL